MNDTLRNGRMRERQMYKREKIRKKSMGRKEGLKRKEYATNVSR